MREIRWGNRERCKKGEVLMGMGIEGWFRGYGRFIFEVADLLGA